METPTLERTFRGHKSAVTSVSFHPNMQQLASASVDCSIMVWNFYFVGHKGPVYDINFSPQGDLLALSSQDRTDASKIASASNDKTVKFWDKEKRIYDRSINMWDTRSAKVVQHCKVHDSNVTSIHFHPSGSYLVSTSIDNTIKIWDVREGQVLYTLHGHDGAVNCAEFSHDSKFIASESVDSFVMVWEAGLDKYLYVDAPKVVLADAKGSVNGVNNSSRKPARFLAVAHVRADDAVRVEHRAEHARRDLRVLRDAHEHDRAVRTQE